MYDTYSQQLRAQQHLNASDTVMANTYAEGIEKVRRSKVFFDLYSYIDHQVLKLRRNYLV